MIAIIKKRTNDAIKKAAIKMTIKIEKYSLRQKKIALTFFCAACTLFCVFAIFDTCNRSEDLRLQFTPVKIPSHIGKGFSLPAPFISKEVFDRIEHFKDHLDSNTKLDRPGLMDSIALFEKIYLSQSKK